MPKRLDQCVQSVIAEGKTQSEAFAICKASFQDGAGMVLAFADRMTYDANERSAVSIRDGVLEYMGAEIGLEPADKVFTIYRSPATIANAAYRMPGIPITDEHVTLDEPAPDHGGAVTDSEMIDALDESTHTTIATRNRLSINDGLRVTVESGKRELSLGYTAHLTPHSLYDFEQKDIVPHHLAVVQDGRCGSMCSFLDRKYQPKAQEVSPMKLHQAFTDEAGAANLQQIAEIAASFPEAIKTMPLDKLQEILPSIMEAMEAAKSAGAEVPAETEEVTDRSDMDEENLDADANSEEDEEDENRFTDSKAFKDAVTAEAKTMADKQSQAFADAAVKRHAEVIEKAKSFVADDYKFTDKSTDQVMRDALATQSTDKFSDEELPLAFKLLRKTANYKEFGDAQDARAKKFDKVFDEEL